MVSSDDGTGSGQQMVSLEGEAYMEMAPGDSDHVTNTQSHVINNNNEPYMDMSPGEFSDKNVTITQVLYTQS